MHAIGRFLIAATLVAFSVDRGARACECGWITTGPDGKPSWGSAPPLEAKDTIDEEAVFLGKAIDVQEVLLGSRGVLKTKVTMEVERYWKGNMGKTLVFYGGLGIDCGFPFDPGQRYVVFASRFPKADRAALGVPSETLYAEECSRTSLAEKAVDLIDRLDRFRKGRVPGGKGASSNHRLDPPHSGVTALAQSRKRRATGRAGQAER